MVTILSLRRCFQHPELHFQLCDLRLKLFNNGSNLLLRESLVNVLRTVDVPRFDLEQNGPFDFTRIGRITQPVEQRRIVFHNTSFAPELNAPAANIVHQEDERSGVLRQIAERDVLAIAAKVGKAQSLLIPGSTKALPANLFNKTNPVEHPDMMQPKVHQ